jgi:hypothetical protein
MLESPQLVDVTFGLFTVGRSISMIRVPFAFANDQGPHYALGDDSALHDDRDERDDAPHGVRGVS